MYSHGLATIALCEAYGMTKDSRLGIAAQAAINFIESGQNREGGWRYSHGSDDSDTSVFGWQVMALKSGQMAGLKVNPNSFSQSRKYLNSVARGNYKSEFGYMPGCGPTFTMTSVGLLDVAVSRVQARRPGDRRRRRIPDEAQARHQPAEHLLLVLCDAGDAQLPGPAVGRLEPDDAPHPDRVAGEDRVVPREVGTPTSPTPIPGPIRGAASWSPASAA